MEPQWNADRQLNVRNRFAREILRCKSHQIRFPHQIRDRLRHISSRGLEQKSMFRSMATPSVSFQIVGIRLAARKAVK